MPEIERPAGRITYAWSKGGQSLEGETDMNYTFIAMAEDDNVAYMCNATFTSEFLTEPILSSNHTIISVLGRKLVEKLSSN